MAEDEETTEQTSEGVEEEETEETPTRRGPVSRSRRISVSAPRPPTSGEAGAVTLAFLLIGALKLFDTATGAGSYLQRFTAWVKGPTASK